MQILRLPALGPFASRSLSDLNSSCLYISSQKTFSSSSVIGFASLRDRSSVSKVRFASSLVIIAFTYRISARLSSALADLEEDRRMASLAYCQNRSASFMTVSCLGDTYWRLANRGAFAD
jgi:hypothetical protein